MLGPTALAVRASAVPGPAFLLVGPASVLCSAAVLAGLRAVARLVAPVPVLTLVLALVLASPVVLPALVALLPVYRVSLVALAELAFAATP